VTPSLLLCCALRLVARIRRCEDARAHAAKVRSAWAEHEREIAAKRTT
jgi:hypothetical protein